LGGCDPINSFSLDSCMPAPVCKNSTSNFNTDYAGIVPNSKYLGDASKADWVSEGEPTFTGNEMLLTMPPESVGTLIASTHYVWYGKISAMMKTSHGAGVVTAFIFLSDVKDEIDLEFVGTELETAQTNYYFQGIPNCKLEYFLGTS
jgi:beta-glucanase (GH16 family)